MLYSITLALCYNELRRFGSGKAFVCWYAVTQFEQTAIAMLQESNNSATYHNLSHFALIDLGPLAIDFLKTFPLHLDQSITLHLSYCIDLPCGLAPLFPSLTAPILTFLVAAMSWWS